jgi:hypothetical protein
MTQGLKRSAIDYAVERKAEQKEEPWMTLREE